MSNYRVVKHTTDSQVSFAVHEVYTSETGETCFSDKPVIASDTLEGLHDLLKMIRAAFKLPTITQ